MKAHPQLSQAYPPWNMQVQNSPCSWGVFFFSIEEWKHMLTWLSHPQFSKGRFEMTERQIWQQYWQGFPKVTPWQLVRTRATKDKQGMHAHNSHNPPPHPPKGWNLQVQSSPTKQGIFFYTANKWKHMLSWQDHPQGSKVQTLKDQKENIPRVLIGALFMAPWQELELSKGCPWCSQAPSGPNTKIL